MSLILDALNKADQERQNANNPPGIHSVHQHSAFPNRKPIWIYIALAIAIILVILGTWFFFFSADNKKAQEQPVVVTPEKPKKSTKIPGLPKPVLVNKEASKPANRPTIKPTIQPTAQKVTKPSASDVSQLYRREQAANANSSSATTKSKPASVNTREAEKTQTGETPNTAHLLKDFPHVGGINDLPWSTLNELPSLNYVAHQYLGDKGRSYVTINDQRKTNGQNLSENIRIDQILEDGVILSYQGQQFKLPALNSWVNI